jgi:WD40 repeat protein
MEWFATHTDALNPLETEFLAESQELAAQKEREREAQQERELAAAQQVAEVERQRAEEQTHSARRLRSRALWLAGLSIIAVVLAGYAFIARANAQREADINHSMALAVSAEEAYRNGYVDLALALAIEAVQVEQPPLAAERALTTVALGAGTRADLYGHNYAVHAADFSSDSKMAISGGCGELASDGRCVKGELIGWDLETFTERNRLVGHTGAIFGLDLSRDRTTVLSASEDGTLKLWDLETGEIMRTFEGHNVSVREVSFSPDGLTAVSGSEDGALILWDTKTGDIIHRFEGHNDVVDSVSFSPDGSSVLSASTDTNLILWDVVTGEAICRLKGHTAHVLDSAYIPIGDYVLSSSEDMTLRLWNTKTCQEERQWVFPSPPVNLAITPNGKTAVFNIDYELRLWDIDGWKPSGRIMGHMEWLTMNFVKISPDGHLVLTGFPDGSLRLWNMAGQADSRHLETSGEPLFGVDLHPSGNSILVGGGAGDAYLRNIESGQIIHRLPGEGYPVNPAGVVISPDGRYALVACEDVFGESGDSSLTLWDLETGEEIRRFEEHITYTRSAAFSPDGQYVLSGSQSLEGEPKGDLILWEVETGDLTRRFETNEDIAGIAFSADGKYAVTGSAYFLSVVLWDVSTGKEIRRFEGHEGQVFAVDFSPDQQAVLSAANDGSLILWDIETGTILRRYLGHDRGVWSFDISPDGRSIISSSEDSIIILWEFKSGQELRRFSGHKAWAPDVAFHPDGQTAYSVSLDGSLIEWQVAAWSVDELLDWVRTNRYVRELTCEERAQYDIEPLCD